MLIATEWVLTGGDPGVADAQTLEFAGSRASGFAGCNRWFAQMEASGEAIQITAIGATRRLCSAEAMESERRFLAALAAARRARVEGGVLVFRDAGGRELARFTRRR